MAIRIGSRFVFERAPDMYTTAQQAEVQKEIQTAYECKQKESVVMATHSLELAMQSPYPRLQELFRRTLAALGARRQEMAQAANSPDWKLFGEIRDKEEPQSLQTYLDHAAYKAYLPHVLQLALRSIEAEKQSRACPQVTTLVAQLYRAPSGGQCAQMHPDQPHILFGQQAQCKHILLEECAISIDCIATRCREISSPLPSYYLFLTLLLHFSPGATAALSSFVIPLLPSSRDLFDAALSKGGEQEPTPDLQKALCSDLKKTSALVERRLKTGEYCPWISEEVMVIAHQSPEYHETMLRKAGQIFAKVIQWKKIVGLPVLQGTVGDLVYLLHHAALFQRGSAAICEHLEMTLYRYHGYCCIYPQDRWGCLEAITSTLEDFRQKYPQLVQLNPLPPDEGICL